MDNNEFIMESMKSGASMDELGGIRHTQASIETMHQNWEHDRISEQVLYRNDDEDTRRSVRGGGGWLWRLFNGR